MEQKSNEMQIWTIGHSTRSLNEFVGLLKENKIELVVDIRRFPTSKKVPHFQKARLEKSLPKNKIGYVWIERLGGFRKYGYLEYTKTKEFKQALLKLIELAERTRTAIMCAEALFFKCHRRFISDELAKLGWTVVHIVSKGKIYYHQLA